MGRDYTAQTLSGKYDLLALNHANPDRYPYLLESTAQSLGKAINTARYDILMAFPQAQLRKTWQGEVWLDDALLPQTDFLQALNNVYRPSVRSRSQSLPFTGGWFLYLGYELVSEIEPSLNLPIRAQNLPVALATRIPAAIIYDHIEDVTYIVVETAFADLLDSIKSDLQQLSDSPSQGKAVKLFISEEPGDVYTEQVQRVLTYIKEGDVFQVNLSRQWQCEHQGVLSPQAIYQQLRKTNPAPFAAYAQIGEVTIISSSPERLVHVNQDRVETRPIAGTRPRDQDHHIDNRLQSELIGNLKERAEHVMLIDLERNDLGRICEPGSIEVDEMMVVESYAHVHHIVSNISGRLKAETLPGDIIGAVFPGGTITGCPKVRCMQIIEELEQTARGAYTGSLGYLNHNGDMDLNILIRTMVIDREHISLRAGAGLVADSDPQRELEETRSKAKGLLLALNG